MLRQLASSNTAFGLKLYGTLRSQSANIFFSPYSLSQALAMAWAGARGETARQMAGTLLFSLAARDLHRAFDALDQELARRAGEGRADRRGDPFRLDVASSLWGRRGETFLPAFVDAVTRHHGAGARVLDFACDPEAARTTINRWTEEKTAGRIKQLIAPGMLRKETVLVLTNAVYFRASWDTPFERAATTNLPFRLRDGTTRTVPTMRLTHEIRYASSADYEAVVLPYVGNKVSLMVIAPRPGRFERVEDLLAPATLATVDVALRRTNIALTLPRLSFVSNFSLRDVLSALGMPVAFGEGADFSGMNARGGLRISEVVHQAFIAIDEKGTEAAAATGAVMGLTSVPPPPVEVRIDRPFLFLVRDEPTGTVLFLGRFAEPTP